MADRKADLEALRALRESHTMKQLSELPLAVKHGWTSKEKLKDALRLRPRSVADGAARKAERMARGPLTEEMLAEIKRRMAAGASLADVRKSDAFGGALRLFPLDLLRRRVSGNVVRTHQCRTAVEYKGLTMLKSGKFQVQYKKKYVGALLLCCVPMTRAAAMLGSAAQFRRSCLYRTPLVAGLYASAELAAAAWNKVAAADGVPPEMLNQLGAAAGDEAAAAAAGVAAGDDDEDMDDDDDEDDDDPVVAAAVL